MPQSNHMTWVHLRVPALTLFLPPPLAQGACEALGDVSPQVVCAHLVWGDLVGTDRSLREMRPKHGRRP
jgi:hypothetical protein